MVSHSFAALRALREAYYNHVMKDLLRSVFSGHPAPWPPDLDAARFLSFTAEQALQPLLRYQLGRLGTPGSWPADVMEALQSAALREAARDVVVERELPRVLEALAGASIPALLLKGTPLSFARYPAPGLRPRADTDLLLRRSDLPAAERALADLEYRPANAVEGDYVSHQRSYAGPLVLDIHWKVLNPVMLADVLEWDELSARAEAVPALGPHARTACPAHALLLACVHRVAHHAHDHTDRLIWLYDIHVLVQGMDPPAFEEFAKLAAGRRVRTLCLAGIEAAHEWFSTNLFADISRRILQVPGAASEPSARYLAAGLRRFDLWKLDLRSLDARGRLRLLREHLFPPAGYMLQKYNTSYRFLLPAFYLHRAVTGLWKAIR